MNKVLLLASCGLLVASVVTAQLVITSFNQNGELTWTNSVSNATYRVEWASSATGPWNKFDALTNLTLLSATTNVVTVKVPMFYRVVWMDPPSPLGDWQYSAYSTQGTLVVTGCLSIISIQSNEVSGTWSFGYTGQPQPHPVGEGRFDGSLSGSSLFLNLNPGVNDDNLFLDGKLTGNHYQGTWFWCGIGCPIDATGNFVALKQDANP
jgi:hypothetical protein